VRWLVFEAEALTQVDATGVAALKQAIADMRAEDMTFVVARFERPDAQSFGSAGVTQRIDEDNFYPTVRAAVDAFQRTP
jgi:MFS superfamily sulfate permease-like transporter